MPRLPPPEEHRWKPGQSGNPKGGAKVRRTAKALADLIDEKGLDRDLALVILAKATGQLHLLKQKVIDPETGKTKWVRRRPDVRWMNMLLDRTEGKVADELNIRDAGADDGDDQFNADCDRIFGTDALPGGGEGGGLPEGPG